MELCSSPASPLPPDEIALDPEFWKASGLRYPNYILLRQAIQASWDNDETPDYIDLSFGDNYVGFTALYYSQQLLEIVAKILPEIHSITHSTFALLSHANEFLEAYRNFARSSATTISRTRTALKSARRILDDVRFQATLLTAGKETVSTADGMLWLCDLGSGLHDTLHSAF
jgi:hypothetical protein